MNIKVGFGYDVHQIVEARPLWLGGIRIPSSFGLQGYSDADVLIHETRFECGWRRKIILKVEYGRMTLMMKDQQTQEYQRLKNI